MVNMLSPQGYDFKKIVFGKADAYKEVRTPELLLDGYLDAYGYIDSLIDGDVYYVFGQKGSGKSAIGSKIELISKTEKKIFAKTYDLEQFDYPGFGGVIPGHEETTKKNLSTWEFLIALKLIEHYDISAVEVKDPNIKIKNIKKGLESMGLIPSKGFNGIIDKMKHRAFKVNVMDSGVEVSPENRINPSDIQRMVSNVINAMYNVSPVKKHIIIIDGLDGTLGRRSVEYEVLSSLINATNIINNRFFEEGINAKVIVLCRNDVMDKLKGTNKNKYIQDSGIMLDWYQDVAELRNTNLNKLINLRAKVSLNAEVSVIDEFFPLVITTGNTKKDTLKYLLEHTRHTPRDFIELMNYIQKVSYQHGATTESIKNGIRKYSENYFVGEIKDGLEGFLSGEEIESIFMAIRRVGHISMTVQELADELAIDQKDVSRMLEALYDAGAIFNVNPSNGHLTSKFRNRYSSFDSRQQIRIHSGLVKAFSLAPTNVDGKDEMD